MKQPTAQSDQTIIRYLLNELSEDDEVRFAEAYLEDEDLFEQVRAMEEELIEDYVRGELSAHQRRLFEKHYLASEQRRARIETARHLVYLSSLEHTPKAAADDRAGDRFASIFSWSGLFAKQHLALDFGIVAALLLIVSLGLVIELFRLRGRIAVVTEERAVLEQRVTEAERRLAHERELLAEESRRGIVLREELGTVSSRLDKLDQELARKPRTSKEQIVILALAPGIRDITRPDRAVISADTRYVELRVSLEKQEELHPYRALVKTIDGSRDIWMEEGIRLRLSRSAHNFVINVPADRFKTAGVRDFMLTVSAQDASGKEYEEIESYYFQVIAR